MSHHQCIQKMGNWPEEGECWRGCFEKPRARQVSPTVELTSLSQGHARLGLQGCGGDWVVVNPRGLGGTHTPTNTDSYITPQSVVLLLAWLQLGSEKS